MWQGGHLDPRGNCAYGSCSPAVLVLRIVSGAQELLRAFPRATTSSVLGIAVGSMKEDWNDRAPGSEEFLTPGTGAHRIPLSRVVLCPTMQPNAAFKTQVVTNNPSPEGPAGTKQRVSPGER
jgi:hypothetical protein